MQSKIILLFYCLFIITKLMATSPQDHIKTKHCRPVEYILSSDDSAYGGKFSMTYRWRYDEQGRLTGDSVYNDNYYGKKVAEGAVWDRFVYAGDSVLHIAFGQDTSVTKFTRTGAIASESLPYGVRYQSYFKANGELETYKVIRPYIGKRGTIENLETIADSIVYSDGDIVSYRVRGGYQPDSILYVTCAYYEAQISSVDFYPMGAITGFSSNPMGMYGGLNVSLFSKHLIKKVASRSNSLEFIFKIDEEGRVSDFDRIFSSTYGGKTYATKDHNAIKYSCR